MSNTKNRYFISLIAVLFLVPGMVQAQYKAEVPSIPGLTMNQSNSSIGFFGIDLSKVEFHNSYSMDVSSFGGNTVALGLLKSSFDYIINPQISVRGYVGLVHAPFANLAPVNQQASFINGINKDNIIYGGEVTYRPRENIFLQININRIPQNAYQQYYSPYPYRTRGY